MYTKKLEKCFHKIDKYRIDLQMQALISYVLRIILYAVPLNRNDTMNITVQLNIN